MVSDIFGGGDKPTQTTQSGFSALPSDLQGKFRTVADIGEQLLYSPEEYFAPMGITSEEEMARYMINPENIGSSISNYLNPFQDIVYSDINRAFEDPYSALQMQADEAGAFGSSKYREGMGDVERARLDAMARASADQYNNAFNQMQTGIGNLLGFGGLERGIDLATRGALPTALSSYGNLINPLLSGSQGNTYQQGAGLGDIGALASGIGAMAMGFSDIRLKENIKLVGKKGKFNIYEFNYKKLKQKFRGVMAHEVQDIKPDAVIKDDSGFYKVDYSKLGFAMEAV